MMTNTYPKAKLVGTAFHVDVECKGSIGDSAGPIDDGQCSVFESKLLATRRTKALWRVCAYCRKIGEASSLYPYTACRAAKRLRLVAVSGPTHAHIAGGSIKVQM